MEDRDVLKQLLKVESSAETLVDEAQAEADRRTAAAEKDARAAYDEAYSRQAAALEQRRLARRAEAGAEYGRLLDAYRDKFAGLSPDYAAFDAILDGCLFGGR
jgi:vacuolar-type H+-ATPase subunit H